MKINLQNYEMYFVRFLDNELTGEEAEEMQLFLQLHPELKNELDAYRSAILVPDEQQIFPARSSLKRSVHTDNYDGYFARWVENDLSQAEISEVNAFLKEYPEYTKHLDAYKSTLLVADRSVVFPDKQSLKKKEPGSIIPLYARYLLSGAVAAGLLLLLFVKGVPWWSADHDMPIAATESTQPVISDTVTDVADNNRQAVSNEVHSTIDGETTAAQKDVAVKPKHKIKSNVPGNLNSNDVAPAVFASVMEPLTVDDPDKLTVYRRGTKAPYLVPVYTEENIAQRQETGSNNLGGWLSIASVVGTEILKLSGRGELLKVEEPATETRRKEALTLSIQTKKFSFYHKFLNKKQSSVKN